MALPASPPITMAQVRAEFGGTAGVTKLSDYVRGGAYVPNTPANSSVPTSTPITLSQLCGASAATGLSVSLDRVSLSAIGVGPGTYQTLLVTATATGGSGSYSSFSWEYVSGSGLITPTAASSAATRFQATLTASSGQVESGYYRCKVIDSASNVAYSANLPITIQN